MSERYKINDRIYCNGIYGTIVTNTKLPGDICVNWDNGQFSSYDEEFLDANATHESDYGTKMTELAKSEGGEHG